MIVQIIRLLFKVNAISNVFSLCMQVCVFICHWEYIGIKRCFLESNLFTVWVPETEIKSSGLTGASTHWHLTSPVSVISKQKKKNWLKPVLLCSTGRFVLKIFASSFLFLVGNMYVYMMCLQAYMWAHVRGVHMYACILYMWWPKIDAKSLLQSLSSLYSETWSYVILKACHFGQSC